MPLHSARHNLLRALAAALLYVATACAPGCATIRPASQVGNAGGIAPTNYLSELTPPKIVLPTLDPAALNLPKLELPNITPPWELTNVPRLDLSQVRPLANVP